jgi:hypothetical protein
MGNENREVMLKLMGNLLKIKLVRHSTPPTIVDWDSNGNPDLLIGADTCE